MTHIIAAVENALTSGRWNDAAPLLSDILSNGVQCTLKPLSDYERLAGRKCDNVHVRQQLTSRLRMVDDAQGRFREHARRFEAERLASIIRDHGHPCRVMYTVAYQPGTPWLKCASRAYDVGRGKWTWEISACDATSEAVALWLGYGLAESTKGS